MRRIHLILIIMTCASAVGCNRVGTYVASILPKKTLESKSSFPNEDFTKEDVEDDTIRPDNSNSSGQNQDPKREGFLTAPSGEGFGNAYDQQEYQQMMGSGTIGPSSPLDPSNGPSGAIPGNPEYGEGTLKHPNEEMIGVGGDESLSLRFVPRSHRREEKWLPLVLDVDFNQYYGTVSGFFTRSGRRFRVDSTFAVAEESKMVFKI